MTEGKILPLILKFAVPLLIGNLLQQTYNIIDAAIVGQALGAKALASVGASTSVQFLVLGFCIGITAGFGIPVAQSFGGDRIREMRRYMYHAALITAFFAVALTTVCAVLCKDILRLLSTSDDIFDGAYAYLLVIFLGIPFTLLYNYLSAMLRSVGDSRTPFYFLAVSTVLNIILDLVCILVFGWGCAGAAIATVVSQAVSGIACLIHILRKVEVLHIKKDEMKFSGGYLGRTFAMGVPMGLQFSITAIGSMVMQSANNGLGSTYVSAYTAALKLKQFFMSPFDAIANGVAVFAGQNLGAGKMKRINEGIRKGFLIVITYGLVAGAILIAFGRPLCLIFIKASETDVLDNAGKYLFCQGLFFWLLGILGTSRMTTQGIGYAGRAVFAGVMEMIARITVSLVFVPKFKFNAICFADQSAWAAAVLYIVPMMYICLNKSKKRVSYKIKETASDKE